MTICRLPVEGDMGKYLLKRTLWKIVIPLSYIFLYIIILTPISIVVAGKFGSDSKEISIFYIGMSIGLLISFLFFIKWLSTSSIEENCVQYIFAITSSNDIWVINCYDPIISSSFKNSRPNIKANLGFYGTIFSFSMRTRYLVNNACKLSYYILLILSILNIENVPFFNGLFCHPGNLIDIFPDTERVSGRCKDAKKGYFVLE